MRTILLACAALAGCYEAPAPNYHVEIARGEDVVCSTTWDMAWSPRKLVAKSCASADELKLERCLE